MQTLIKTVTDKPATEIKADALQTPVETEQAAVAANAHIAAGASAKYYNGLSSYFNSNRATSIRVLAAKRNGITERMQACVTALRTAYDTKSFPARGLDNGILANLQAAGYVTFSGGITGPDKNGTDYRTDAEKPVTCKLLKRAFPAPVKTTKPSKAAKPVKAA